jgi:hypothetical protein
MITVNRARRGSRRVRSTRAVSPGRKHAAPGRTYGLAEYGGGALTAAAFLVPRHGAGWSAGQAAVAVLKGSGSVSDLKYNIVQTIPFVGTDDQHTVQRAEAGAGIALWIGGHIANKIGFVRRLTHRKLSIKVDRKRRVALT